MFVVCRDCGAIGTWYWSRNTGLAICHACQRAGGRHSPPPVNRRRRTAIPEELARVIRARPCSWCHAPGPSHVDHILPVAQGGTDDLDNLQSLCRACNTAKGGRSMWQWAQTADGTRRLFRGYCV